MKLPRSVVVPAEAVKEPELVRLPVKVSTVVVLLPPLNVPEFVKVPAVERLLYIDTDEEADRSLVAKDVISAAERALL